jgi:nitroreductase
MDAIELLTTRASNGKLSEPAPDESTLRLAFEAAARAPDHAGLHPIRVKLIRGAARERFGDLMAASVQRAKPNALQDELLQTKNKALRAPLIVVVAAALTQHPKVPEIEQVLTAGAAAHAMLLVLQARGFAGIWRTGAFAYDPIVRQALGFKPSDAIVGFLYIGTPRQPAPSLPRPLPEDFVSDWAGSP